MVRNSEDKRQSSLDPDERLHAERVALHYPWSLTPFVDQTKGDGDDELDETVEDEKGTPITSTFTNELKVKIADEVPWIDLILEIAMTTALANLTNNTTLSRGKDVLGYLCFWALTWWVWASTVAYNVRFRQADWIHRWAAIFQLAVFGALAAFTQNFDITAGLIINGNDPDQNRASRIQIALGSTSSEGIMAQLFQQARLPGLNFRGIAMTMAWSRVLLMTQYIIVYIHALRQRQSPHRFSPALLVHITSLLLSAGAFFFSFFIIGHDTSTYTRERNITKIVLWYGALLVEMMAHFLPPAFNMRGHVRYSPKGLYSRASVLFLIVLGLDQLTGTFSFAVGPAGFGKTSIGLLISTATILIGQFSLFFGSPSLKKRCVRGLAWFFGQFIYTSALIVLISATANELIVTNFFIVADHAIEATVDVQLLQVENLPNLLPANQVLYNDSVTLMKSGIAPADIINATFEAFTSPNFTVDDINATVVQQNLKTFLTVAQQFGLEPKGSDALYWDFQWALSKPNDVSVANLTTLTNLYATFLREHGDSVTWFPAAGGGALIITALLRYVRQTPRDRWEWIQTLTVGLAGVGYALLSIMDIGSRRPIVTQNDLNISFNSAIFKFEDSGWVLPSFAILNLVILIALGLQSYFARRSTRRKIESRPLNIYEQVPLHLRQESVGPFQFVDPYVVYTYRSR